MKKPLTAIAIAVTMFSLGSLGVASAAPLVPANPQVNRAANPMETLSFLGMANVAVSEVRAVYPDAELLEAQGRSSAGSTDDVTKVTDWRFIFRLSGNRHATVDSTGWGTFSDPIVIDRPWLGDQKITWTPEEFLDIRAADERLKNAGYTGDYKSVTLRKPLYPGIDEPYYIFNFADGGHIAVGLADGAVVQFH
ncbi:hypothetical protein ACGFX8_35830 [Streptomyces sp. NPDC048362]|uniref:hypothetical protein n=1 Tax=Streptomyces sp. NPDC048362 TaxID=3365539 RepID=UPI0037236351